MDAYRHHVSGFFATREQAEAALTKLVARGLPRKQVHILAADSVAAPDVPETKSDKALKDVLVDSAIGTGVGAGVGILGEIALVAANVSLFVASPLLAPLMMMGWGASLGALIGAAAGASPGSGDKKGWFSDLVQDAIASGQTALVAETRTEQETTIAREVIKTEVGECKDVSSPTTV
ncbi:MAG: hypothetical protein ACXW1P_00420 [Methylophilaceae bacterium]